MINRTQVRLSQLALGLALALAAAPAFAQNTSSAVGGRVSDGTGQPIAGAQVTITHTESGTVSQVTTDADGRYISRNLRVGGPYKITVTKDGKTETRDGVYLDLAATNNVDAVLGAAPTALSAVTVVGSATESVFSPNKMGTTTNIDRSQIENLPSATRNIQDYIRLDPRITQVSKADGAISAGGQNSRYNSIKIDGVGTSDPFGLESNNLPTERQPVSVDAIEAINIALADYDVTIAGGVGAVVNAVTKSGTNEFHGSVYYSFRDKDWVRETLRGVAFTGFDSETTYGATFGGPLVKDKLFFFANYENYIRKSPGVGLGDTPYGIGRITDADITRVQNAAAGYGFEAGDLGQVSADTEIEEKAIKLDWNINADHRASLRYSETEQSVVRFPELDNNSVSLSSFWYALPKAFDSTVVELFSDWSENFSTEFKLSNRGYTAVRDTFTQLPSIRINGYPNSTLNNSIFLGTEQNSHVNRIETDQDSFFGAANWYAGDHVVKVGFDYEQNDIVNFFGRNLNGAYEFPNIAAFEAGTPSRYIVRVPVPGGNLEQDVPAQYGQENLALFAQDTWTVNNNLTLTFGLRWDKPSYDAQPKHNTFIQGIYGYDNTVVPDTSLLQPRAAFNYTFDSERPTQFRGGVGLFQGATPNVWIAGAYQNTGLNYLEYDLANPGPIFTDSVSPPYYPPANLAACFPTPTLSTCARQNVDIIEPGFALPSSWKANLAFEHELPWDGIVFSAEFVRSLVKDGVFVQRLDLYNAAGQGVTRTGRDGRDLFWNPTTFTASSGIGSLTNAKFYRPAGVGDVLLLKNTDKGASSQFTIGLDRPFKNNWSWNAFYTYTEATEVSPLTSSINNSNWNGQLVFDANEEVAYNSRYAIRDRFTGTINWQHAFFGDYKTKVGLFYEGRSGRPYSLVFRNDANGDGNSSAVDLFYIPNPGDVVFSGGAAMEASFFAWLDANPDYKRYQGRVAPANAFRAGFTHNFDLRLTQELPGFLEGHKASISFDINNVGNLIDKDWGLIDDFGFFTTARVASYAGVCHAAGTSPTAVCKPGDVGKYVYNWGGSADQPQIQENNNDKGNTAVSRWSVLATFKYEF